MGKWGKVFVITAGLIILSLVGLVFTAIYKAASPGINVPRQIAALRAKGQPTTLAELQPRKIPDAENGALIYASIFKIIKSQNVLGTEFDSINHIIMPDEPKTPQLWSQSRQLVNKYSEALTLVDDAVAKPQCVFPYKLGDDADSSDRHLQDLRTLSTILAAKAILDARDGKMEQAAHWVSMQFRVSESIKDEPLIVSCLARISLIKRASLTLSEIMRYGSISESSAKQLLGILSSIDLYPGFKTALIGDRALAIGLYQSLGTPSVESSGNSSSNKGNSQQVSGSPMMKLIMGKGMHRYLDTVEKQIAVSAHSFREIKHDHPSLLRVSDESFVFSVGGLVFVSRDEAVVNIAGSKISLALEIYKKRFGQYPQRLDDLRTIDFKAPKDLFSGKDFIYKKQGSDYLLYSIGSDLRDNGGKRRLYTKAVKKNDKWPQPVDIVWSSKR